jgi:hypothetical protein
MYRTRGDMDDATITDTRQGRRGPVEGEHLIGFDREQGRRPGAPMFAPPAPAEGAPEWEPVQQEGADHRDHRSRLHRPTPVFGTAQPLHGMSGLIRRAAYEIPEHHARHWALLLAADRVDVLEDLVGALMAAPVAAVGARAAADRVRSNPLPYLAGLVVGAIVGQRVRRSLAGSE